MRLGLLLAALAIPACGERAVVVGSKNFTEQNVLAEIVAQELEAHGLAVDRRLHLGGTLVCHRALVGDEIDLYVEYTGTALTAILELDPEPSANAVYARVKAEYQDRWGLVWGPPLGFENTFALVVRRADAESLRLRSITDLTRVANDLTAAFGPEFMARPDGYPGLERAYGLTFGGIRQMDLGLMYRALADRQVDVAVGNSTDGAIEGLDLVVLDDDRGFFPPYEAAPVVRAAALERHPEIERALAALEGRLSAATMRRLNHAVDVEGRAVAEVAGAWRRSVTRAERTGTTTTGG